MLGFVLVTTTNSCDTKTNHEFMESDNHNWQKTDWMHNANKTTGYALCLVYDNLALAFAGVMLLVFIVTVKHSLVRFNYIGMTTWPIVCRIWSRNGSCSNKRWWWWLWCGSTQNEFTHLLTERFRRILVFALSWIVKKLALANARVFLKLNNKGINDTSMTFVDVLHSSGMSYTNMEIK